MNRRKTLEDRLAQYAVPHSNGCVLWEGYTDKDGYPITCMTLEDGKKNRKVHRLVLERSLGRSLKPGMFACHSCDTPNCVNEDHLFEGSALDNNQDMISKGRQRSGEQNNHGERNPNRKLSQEDVLFIRKHHVKLSKKSPHSTGNLARMFGVHPTQIQKIVREQAWA